MAIITKPQTIVKNQNNSFTLIKDDILDLTLNDVSIFAGSKFADSTTWKTVRLKYRSLTTKEYEVVEFNAQQVSPSGIFFVSEDADNDFKVVNITIANFDNATFVINRDLLDSCEINNILVDVESTFDVDFDVTPPVVEDLWAFYASPDAIVDEYKVLFNGATGSGVRRQAFTKLIPNSKTGAEFYFNPSYAFNYCIGLIGMNENPTSFSVGQNLSDFFYDPSRQFVIWFASNGSGATIYKNTTVVASIGDSISTSDKIGCFVDPIAKTVQFTKNGTNIGSPVSFADQPSYAQLRFSGYRGDSIGEVGLSSTISYPLATYENIASNLAGNPIIWDLFLNGSTTEVDGGLYGGFEPPVMRKSSASKIENGADFKITYNFTGGYGTISNVIHAVMPSVSDTGYIGMTGITYQTSSEIQIYDNYSSGGPQASFSNSMMNLDGSVENVAVFEKVGNVLTIKMNGVLIYTKNNYTDQTTVPSVRTFGQIALNSAYIE